MQPLAMARRAEPDRRSSRAATWQPLTAPIGLLALQSGVIGAHFCRSKSSQISLLVKLLNGGAYVCLTHIAAALTLRRPRR